MDTGLQAFFSPSMVCKCFACVTGFLSCHVNPTEHVGYIFSGCNGYEESPSPLLRRTYLNSLNLTSLTVIKQQQALGIC